MRFCAVWHDYRAVSFCSSKWSQAAYCSPDISVPNSWNAARSLMMTTGQIFRIVWHGLELRSYGCYTWAGIDKISMGWFLIWLSSGFPSIFRRSLVSISGLKISLTGESHCATTSVPRFCLFVSFGFEPRSHICTSCGLTDLFLISSQGLSNLCPPRDGKGWVTNSRVIHSCRPWVTFNCITLSSLIFSLNFNRCSEHYVFIPLTVHL